MQEQTHATADVLHDERLDRARGPHTHELRPPSRCRREVRKEVLDLVEGPELARTLVVLRELLA